MQSFRRRIFSTLGGNSNNINNNNTNNILVINCGSSSVKFQIIDPLRPEIQKISGIAERLATPKAFIKVKVQDHHKKQTIPIENSNHKVACDHIYELIKARCSKIRKKVQFQKCKNTFLAISKMAKNQFLPQEKV